VNEALTRLIDAVTFTLDHVERAQPTRYPGYMHLMNYWTGEVRATLGTLEGCDNPYWRIVEALRLHEEEGDGNESTWDSYGMRDRLALTVRRDFVDHCSYTIPSPDTVDYVNQHILDAVVDPFAGTGYWAGLLGRSGVPVFASDLDPPDGKSRNRWHRQAVPWGAVEEADGVAAVRAHPDATLLISWPIMSPIAASVLKVYDGSRVIYMGEDDNCATDRFFHLLDNDWELLSQHEPTHWCGIYDRVAVYDRR
jgi:hypothetical protein